MKILVEREIPNGSKRIGWGWGTEPTGEDAWSIKLPTRPDVIGTMKDCAEEAEHARRVCGDAFWSGRWFVDDWPIVQIWDLILVYKDEWEVYAHGRRCVFDHEPTYEELENIDAPSIGNRVINSRASHYGWIETNRPVGRVRIEVELDDHAILTVREVARIYGVAYPTVTAWCRDVLLMARKFGRAWAIPASALADFKPPARGRPKI